MIISGSVVGILLVLLSVAGVLLVVMMWCVCKRKRKKGEIVEEINQPAKPECSEPANEMVRNA